jgi:hypothetical protein
MAWHRSKEQEGLTLFLSEVSEGPSTLSAIAEFALNTGLFELYYDRNEIRFWEYAKTAHLARTWHWCAMFGNGSYRIHLPGIDPFDTEKVRANIAVRFDTWVDGVYLSMILRDNAAMEVYRAVPYEPLHNRMGAIMDEFNGIHQRFLVAIGVDDEVAGQAISALIAHVKGKWEEYDALDKPWVEWITLPYLEMWQAFLSGDETTFNSALKVQQKGWKKAYSVDRNSSIEIHGYYCMPALAACALAFDRGMKITVKSDYLPVFLIKGEYRMHWPDLEWVK